MQIKFHRMPGCDLIYFDFDLITAEELAARIGLSTRTVRNYIQDGRFVESKHFIRFRPGLVRFLWSAIGEWLKERRSDPRNKTVLD